MNLYGYANGDPVNYADPFGLYADRQDEGESSDEGLADDREDRTECAAAVAIAVLSTAGDASIGLGAFKMAAWGVRAIGHGNTARVVAGAARSGLTEAGAEHMARVAAGEVASSNASIVLGTQQVATTVGAAAEGVAGEMSRVTSAAGTSGWDFVPIVGTVRAWNNVRDACAAR
jgi:hypothetical protein